MNRPTPGTNPRRRRRNNNNNFNNNNSMGGASGSNSVRRMISGATFTPSEMPPIINAQPWNNVRLLFKISVSSNNDKAVTLADIREHCHNQLGFSKSTTSAHYDLRIKSIAAWMEEVGHISMYPLDFVNGSAAEFARVDSYSMKNMYARVGYHYPAHVQASTLSTKKTQTCNLVMFSTTVGATVNIALDVLWKGADTVQASEVKTYVYPKKRAVALRKDLTHLVEELSLLEQEVDSDEHVVDDFELAGTA